MVDMQVTAELAALLAVVVHVTELMAVASVFPLFSIVIVNEISPHTGVVEHVYVTFSLASAVVLSTVQLGVVATEKSSVKIKLNLHGTQYTLYTMYEIKLRHVFISLLIISYQNYIKVKVWTLVIALLI